MIVVATAPNSGEQAIAKARAQSAGGPRFGMNECLMRVRLAYGVDTIIRDAAASWSMSPHKHRTGNPSNIPRGVPVYWTGGTKSNGHVAISTGDGECWSTDIRRIGFFDKVPIAEIHAKWGLTLVGWTDDINGELVTVPVTTYGIDASHYQLGNGLSVTGLPRQGYDFLVLKCTQGRAWSDATYPAALAAAEKAGMLVAAYHFLEHANVEAQAANLAAHIVDRRVPVVVDVEATGANVVDLIGFRTAAERLGLNVTMKYLPKWYWEQLGKPSLVGPLALWASAYPSNKHDYGSRLYPGATDPHWAAYGGQVPALWQFTSTGKVDGYSGNVDINAYRGSRADLAATGFFHDFAKPTPPPPVKPTKPPVKPPVDPSVKTTTHTHLQLNVQRTMSKGHVTADLEKAFSLAADSIVFNEMETAWHHAEADRLATAHGYALYTPSSTASGAIVVAVRTATATVVYEKSLLCAPGSKGLSPNRYFNRVQITRNDTHEKLAIGGTQMWSSGWTGSTSNDVLRKARWYVHMAVMYPTFRRTAKHNHVSIGSGDLNRPPSSFPTGKVLGRMLNPAGMRSVGYAHTDHTHAGTTFDYVWWASKHAEVSVKSWSTPAFNSDHDGVLVTLTWPTSTDAVS